MSVKHDIPAMLTVVSMSVVLVGVMLGFQFTTLRQQLMGRTTLAGSLGCRYYTTVEVRKDRQGTLYSEEEAGSLQAVNNRKNMLPLTAGGFTRGFYNNDNHTFDSTGRKGYAENESASVTLQGLDTKTWEVKSVFCDPKPGSMRGCPTSDDIAKINVSISTGRSKGLTIAPFKVNCGVDLTYGWIVARKPGAPTPTPSPIRSPASPTPRVSPIISTSPTGGKGTLEVQVVALNYPQKTSIFPPDNVASHKPASCTRQGSTEDLRPLYLNPIELRATCVGGGCQQGKKYDVEIDKRKGYGSFTNIDAGQYKIEVKDIKDGYRLWSGCAEKAWTVNGGQISRDAVAILQNETEGTYEPTTTEKLCKDDKGIPHLIEGVPVACYFVSGNEPGPQPSDEPNPQPSHGTDQKCNYENQPCKDDYYEGCTINGQQGTKYCHKVGTCSGVGDGTKCRWQAEKGSYCEACVPNGGPVPTTVPGNGATVKVRIKNRSEKIRSVDVRLAPCPSNGGPCTTTINFTGTGDREGQFNNIPANTRYRMYVQDPTYFANEFIAANGQYMFIKALHCGGGNIEWPNRQAGNDNCLIGVPSFSEFEVSVRSSNDPSVTPEPPRPQPTQPPVPQPPAPRPPQPQPPRSRCGYYLKPNGFRPGDSPKCFVSCLDDPRYNNCSPETLRPYFGQYGEEVLAQAAGICWNESRGVVDVMNARCFKAKPKCVRGGPADCWFNDYSAGLFQLNQIGVCVDPIATDGTHGPSCKKRPGIDPEACINEKRLLTLDGNARAALEKFNRSDNTWGPWNNQCNN